MLTDYIGGGMIDDKQVLMEMYSEAFDSRIEEIIDKQVVDVSLDIVILGVGLSLEVGSD